MNIKMIEVKNWGSRNLVFGGELKEELDEFGLSNEFIFIAGANPFSVFAVEDEQKLFLAVLKYGIIYRVVTEIARCREKKMIDSNQTI